MKTQDDESVSERVALLEAQLKILRVDAELIWRLAVVAIVLTTLLGLAVAVDAHGQEMLSGLPQMSVQTDKQAVKACLKETKKRKRACLSEALSRDQRSLCAGLAKARESRCKTARKAPGGKVDVFQGSAGAQKSREEAP